MVHIIQHSTLIIAGVLLSLEASLSERRTCKLRMVPRMLDSRAEYFTNTWAVRILGGFDKAKQAAGHLGFNFRRKISEGLADIYLFQHPTYPKKSNYSSTSITQNLLQYPTVSWAEQQIAEVRRSRRRHTSRRSTRSTAMESELSWDDPEEAYSCPELRDPNESHTYALNLNDKCWPKQYYIKDCRQDYVKSPNDLNVAPVWVQHRLFGKNIRVVVVDDGLETGHEDLVDNYDRNLGLDLQDEDASPDPVHYLWRKFSHGTRCAGIIGMKGNNTICGVGIAPSVTLGAVRLLGPLLVTDYKISRALSFKRVDVHIMSNSWGPSDNGKSMSYLGILTHASLKMGVKKGREGRGVIYVFAVGNGKKKGDHCGCDAMISSMYTIAVASCNYRGRKTDFSERCAGIMVTTYSGEHGGQHRVVTTDGGNKCTTGHFGTSASSPMAAGAIALTLEANPKLSWRDVQHLLAWTSRMTPLRHNVPNTWEKNGAGLYVSHDFGFGLLDVNGMVEKAIGFKSVGPMNTCVTKVPLNEDGQPIEERLEVEVSASGCEGSPSEVRFLEHVQLTVSVGVHRRGDLQIVLISPAGTKAKLLEYRFRDSFPCGIRNWTFDSIMTWGESPNGKWKIIITTKPRKGGPPRPDSLRRTFLFYHKYANIYPICFPPGDVPIDASLVGDLADLTLTFRGTSEKHMPDHYTSGPRTYQ